MDKTDQVINKLLNQLINIYERRYLKNPSEFNRNIYIRFTNKTISEYFNESSQEFYSINKKLKLLEENNLLTIVWQNGIKDHIIQRITLNTDNIDNFYKYLKRKPINKKLNDLLELIKDLQKEFKESSLVQSYLQDIIEKLNNNNSIKSLVDLDNLKKLDQTASFLFYIDTNDDECFIREFSVKNFNDSKLFEKNLKRVISLIKRYRTDLKDRNEEEVLEEFNIYTNPVYLRIKGTGIFQIGNNNNINLKKLAQGISIASSDLELLRLIDSSQIDTVITVENLTSFFRLNRESTLIIYIGGFHNKIHRKFLKNLAQTIPNNRFFHFGDIDVGGFLILFDLIKKTGIKFKPYLMGLDTINQYDKFTLRLTENDFKRFKKLIENIENGEYENCLSKTEQNYYVSLFEKLIQNNKKLEQEAIYWKS